MSRWNKACPKEHKITQKPITKGNILVKTPMDMILKAKVGIYKILVKIIGSIRWTSQQIQY